jgi:hypothetical protein
MKLIVQNKTNKLLVLPPVRPFGPAQLIPGMTEVDADHVQALEDNRTVRGWVETGKIALIASPEMRAAFERGEFQELEPGTPTPPLGAQIPHSQPFEGPPSTPNATPPAGDTDGPAADLSTFNADEAGELIDAEVDAEILRGWLAAEKRKGVRSHLEARLAALGA